LHRRIAAGERSSGPVIYVNTSSGFNAIATGRATIPLAPPEWEPVRAILRTTYGLVETVQFDGGSGSA